MITKYSKIYLSLGGDICIKLKELYSQRIDIYKSTADITVPDMKTPDEVAEYIITKRLEMIE